MKTIKGSRSLVFNHDGTKWAYIANNDGGDFLVLNGKTVSMEYQSLSGPVFSPGESHVFATALHNGQHFLLVDGKEQGPYKYLNINELVFSPDGKDYAFIENLQARQMRLIVNGKASEPLAAIEYLAYLPDGRLVYSFLKEANREVTQRGLEQYTLVVGDKAVGVNTSKPAPIFSADGGHVAYVDMSRPADWDSLHYVVDGKHYPPPPGNRAGLRAGAFSPGGRHFVYIAGAQLYVDGQPAGPQFDPGTRLGLSGPPSAAGAGPADFTFPERDKVQVFFVRGNAVYRLTASLN